MVPLCQAVHTLEPGTPRHAPGEAQGHAPLSLARDHERRGNLDLWTRRSPTAGTRPPCRAALCLPRHPTLPPLSSIPCTSLLLMPVPAAQPLSRAEDVPLQLSLCFSTIILSKGAWILYRGLAHTTSAARSPTTLLYFPQKNPTFFCLV